MLSKISLLIIFISIISCSPNPYQEICSNFAANYCKGKEFFEDTLYFTNEFVENHKKLSSPDEITCKQFQENFEIDSKFSIYLISFRYKKKYENDVFLDTINSKNLISLDTYKKGSYKGIGYNLVKQNGIWKIHRFYFQLSNQTVDPVDE